jgi:hypothetical protein
VIALRFYFIAMAVLFLALGLVQFFAHNDAHDYFLVGGGLGFLASIAGALQRDRA